MVKPKQKRVEEAREALKLAQQSLAQKQASLQKVGERQIKIMLIKINFGLFLRELSEAEELSYMFFLKQSRQNMTKIC